MLFDTLRSAEPFRIAMERINNNEELAGRLTLGEPIESELWGFNGQYNSQPGGGGATYSFPIRGKRGAAHVYFEAYQDGQTWHYEVFDVTMPNGDVISLADSVLLEKM